MLPESDINLHCHKAGENSLIIHQLHNYITLLKQPVRKLFRAGCFHAPNLRYMNSNEGDNQSRISKEPMITVTSAYQAVFPVQQEYPEDNPHSP